MMPPQQDNGSSSFDYRSLIPSRFQQPQQEQQPQPTSSSSSGYKSSYTFLGAVDTSTGGSNNNNNSFTSGGGDYYTTTSSPSSSWCCDELSFRERMLGFGTCLVAGYMLSFGSFFRLGALMLGNPRPLVVHAALGNLLAWAGSFFLSGPQTQWKRLWEEKRRLATQAYLVSLALMIAILVFHPWGPEGLYLFILIIVQNGAMTWYCLSYIPFAQETVASWCSRHFNTSSLSQAANEFDLTYMPAPV